MASKSKSERTIDVTGVDEDVDLDREEVRLPDGSRLTEDAAAALGDELAAPVVQRRGRPSLSGGSTKSPQVGVRVSEDVHSRLVARAEAEGKRLSDVVRDALERYVS